MSQRDRIAERLSELIGARLLMEDGDETHGAPQAEAALWGELDELLDLRWENEALIDCARVLEAYTGCAGTGYHRWLERRDRALAGLDDFFDRKGSGR